MKLFHVVVVALVLAISTIPCSHGRWNLLSKKRTTTVEKKNGSWRFPWKRRKTDDEPPRETRTLVQSLKQKRRWGNKSEKIQEKKSLGKKNVTEETNSNEKKRKLLKTNSTHSLANNVSSCASLKQTRNVVKRHGDAANADMAYRMAILSSLAYWNFDKQPTNNMSSFRLISSGRRKAKQTSLRQSAKVALCHVATGIRNRNSIVEKYHNQHHSKQQPPCRQVVSRQAKSGFEFDFQWYLHDWHEPTPLAGKWHDTDLLVATSGDDMLVLSFAGTASAADAVTNVQTFERAGHSRLFRNITAGSIHRGFLNAYSRVERGKVSRICQKESCDHHYNNLTSSLHQRFQHCHDYHDQSMTNYSNGNTTLSRAKRQTCKARNERLMFILRELATSALMAGHEVHLTGHSLGGGLSTLFALDIILNFPLIPISKLYLWTFGSPQVVDEVFLRSAMDASPRLKGFISNRRKRRYHRYVTLSDKCKPDVVSTIASNAIASHKRGLYGRVARRLGGVRGRVIHMAEPHYLPPLIVTTNDTTTIQEKAVPTRTGSTLAAHHITSYLQGISRESSNHPLMTNLPAHVANMVGEVSLAS